MYRWYVLIFFFIDGTHDQVNTHRPFMHEEVGLGWLCEFVTPGHNLNLVLLSLGWGQAPTPLSVLQRCSEMHTLSDFSIRRPWAVLSKLLLFSKPCGEQRCSSRGRQMWT